MECKICGDNFYYSVNGDPEEPCFCGAMCTGSIYQWVGLRGYFMLILCKLCHVCEWITDIAWNVTKYFSWKE